MLLTKEMPINAAARLVGEHDTRIWRILHRYVDQAGENVDYSGVTQVGLAMAAKEASR